MTDSQALLAEYARDGSEKAFRELVARYIDLVYSTALRMMEGDTYLAQDAAQNVFIHLARKAKSLGQDVMLGGRLHRDTCHVAATMLRGERRRQSRERRAAKMNDESSGSGLETVTPILDEAIEQAALVKVITMTKIKAGIISGLLVAGVATPFVLQQQTQNRLRTQNDSLRAQVAQIPQLEAEDARLSNLVSETKSSLPNGQMDELVRLRAQVGDLKRQLAEATQATARLKQQAKDDAQAATDVAHEKQALELTMISRMNDAKQLMLAFYNYAGRDGQLPTNFDQVAGQLPPNLDTNRFQIVYHGSISSLTNPASTIVVREIEAHPTPDGTWVRTYGFADGHTEVHTSADGDFSAWEQQHGVPAL